MRDIIQRILEIVLRIDKNTRPDEPDEPNGPNGRDEPDEMPDTLELGSDEETHNDIANKNGVRIEVSEEIHGLEVTLSDRVDGLTTAYIADEDGTTVEQQTISHLEAGDSFSFRTTLEPGIYDVIADANGVRNYNRGRREFDYPLEAEKLTAVEGVYNADTDDRTTRYRYNFSSIEPHGERYTPVEDTVGRPDDVITVNVVDEDSIDEDGDIAAEILSFLGGFDRTNHEFILPSREYLWNSNVRSSGGRVDYLEIRGEPRAQVNVRTHDIRYITEFGAPTGTVVLRNLDVDISDDPHRDCGIIDARVDNCLVDNVAMQGRRYWRGNHQGGKFTIFPNIVDPDGEAIIRNVHLPDGDTDTDHPMPGYAIPFSVDPPHEGDVTFERCIGEEWVGNCYYLRNSPGNAHLKDSFAANNSGAQIRLGKNDSAENCQILFDDMRGRNPGSGLWLQTDNPTAEDITIESEAGNHELVRINASCDGGLIRGLQVRAGGSNDHHTVRCSGSSRSPDDIVIEDFEIVDASLGGTESSTNSSINCSRDMTLRDGAITIDDECPRDAIGGGVDPELEDVEINE